MGGNGFRVLVVDDSPVSRRLLSALLEADPEIVAVDEVSDGMQAVESVARERPDVVIMDILMPRMNGLEATRRIMDRSPVPIVISSAAFDMDEARVIAQTLRAGAVAVLNKPRGRSDWEAAQLVDTVKAMARLHVSRTSVASGETSMEAEGAVVAVGAGGVGAASPGLEEWVHERQPELGEYAEHVGNATMRELQRLAEPLQGRGWANVNSTFLGGGVAEILNRLVPLARTLGIDARWYSIRGHNGFFSITKKFHNALQGMDLSIGLDELVGYLDVVAENARGAFIASDLVVVHDPQPAALLGSGTILGSVLWRCHIDTSRPNPLVWHFLLPYINQCAGTIFTMPEFVGPGLRVPAFGMRPCIDPLAEKNRQRSREEALAVLAPLLEEHDVDPERPILAAVSRYDVHKNQAGILRAFRALRAAVRSKPPPYLIFLGNTASDDPEGQEVLERLRAEAGDDPDVRFWVDVPDNDRTVGSLFRIARAAIQVSSREGFGLVVSESLWQGTPVIGSSVGGIPAQVRNGTTGWVVDPADINALTTAMHAAVTDPERAHALGAAGREHVRRNFLLPHLVHRYLRLFRHHLKIDEDVSDLLLAAGRATRSP